jgi:hypothetical protein
MEKKYHVLRIIVKFQIAIGSICLILGCFYYFSIIQKNRIPGFGLENYPLEILGIIISIISGLFWIAIWLLFKVIIDIEENTRVFFAIIRIDDTPAFVSSSFRTLLFGLIEIKKICFAKN